MTRHSNIHSVKGPSQRQLRVGEELRHALAMILERAELRDPVLIKTQITVTEVRLSPDLKNATCFVTPLGGGDVDTIKEVIAALERAKKYLRHEVVQRVNLRYAPTLHFVHDVTFDNASHIDELLHQPEVARDLHADDDGPSDGPSDGLSDESEDA
jgi:ribosome-binding factor A